MENHLAKTPITVVAAGRTFSLDPVSVGFEIDDHAVVRSALENGRSGNLFGQFGWWLGHFGDDDADIELPYVFDETALANVVDNWQTNGIADPAHPGTVTVEDGAIVFSYPRSGTGIEMNEALAMLEATLTDRSRPAVELPTRFIEAQLTEADIDGIVSQVGGLLSAPITLHATDLDRQVTVPRSVLADALRVERIDDTSSGVPEFQINFDQNDLLAYVGSFAPYLETDPVDADLVIDTIEDTVTVVPSVPVQEPDPAGLVEAVWSAVAAPDRSAELPYRAGREAELSTEDVEAFGVKELISEFTTFHSCCQPRVTNIQQIADDTDGTWVMPGEVFSLNETVGRRTIAGGYVCAGALLRGEVVDEGPICIGGGTSQFTTTLYNAVFFAGVEDVYHFKHTAWFSRYPEGREATLGFPNPDIKFRNNTDAVIVIKTLHTDTSITVKFYGDNGGIEVEAGLSNRYNHSGIVDGGCVPKDVVPSGQVFQNGSPGWTVNVYRYITYPDGTRTTETWVERYTGLYKLKSC
jgi:vancomycin resistance protein YoaR